MAITKAAQAKLTGFVGVVISLAMFVGSRLVGPDFRTFLSGMGAGVLLSMVGLYFALFRKTKN
jgi:hypothetical protein